MSDIEPRGRSAARPLLIAALVMATLFAGAHLLGLRAYTAILSGTAPPGASGGEAVALGLVYVILYFAAVIVAPILAIAAGLSWAAAKLGRRRAD